MQIVAITVVAMGTIMAAMAVGVIFSGRRLRGSCGGTGTDCACLREDKDPSQCSSNGDSGSGSLGRSPNLLQNS